jgi:ankyrin repeat protein
MNENEDEVVEAETVLGWDGWSVELSISPLEFQDDDVLTEIADPALVELNLELFPGGTIPSTESAKFKADYDDYHYNDEGSFSNWAKRQRLLPYAPSISEYLQPNGYLQFRPHPEWWPLNKEYNPSLLENGDTILHAAIRENATEAALTLIEMGSKSVQHVSPSGTSDNLSAFMQYSDSSSILIAANQDGITPLTLASQQGNFQVAQALLWRSHLVNPADITPDGTNPFIEAARFGHVAIIELLLQNNGPQLLEVNVNDGTTALMCAAQEGHLCAVEYLLRQGATVDRRDREQMTALLLAAQHGHAAICQRLLQAGANVDHVASQNTTGLLLACRRGHVEVVRVLVAAGCALHVLHQNRWRTRSFLERRYRWDESHGHRHRLREIMGWGRRRREGDDDGVLLSAATKQSLYQLLDPVVQVDLMQQATRKKRNWELTRMQKLLQHRRAQLYVPNTYTAVDAKNDLQDVVEMYNHPPHALLPFPQCFTDPSTEALTRTMTLPEPLVQIIALFLPMPKLWEKRIDILRSSAYVNANEAIFHTLDLIDEMLEEGGFLKACDVAQVPAPGPFTSWADWKRSASTHSITVRSRYPRRPRNMNVTEAIPPPPQDPAHPTIHEMRRKVGYLPLMAQYMSQSKLQVVLTEPPYRMPQHLLQQLILISDIASISRRCGGEHSVYFEANAAVDIITLASWLCSWYRQELQNV